MIDHLQKQIAFLVEADKLKTILRKTSPIHTQERKENSAEHSWQVALAACLLADYANQPIDLLRVLKMLLLHDISEIDTNDTFHYDKTNTPNSPSAELLAAKRIFALLPTEQRDEWLSLWQEFEARESNDACFAAALDRLMPILVNYHSAGGSWKEYGITAATVIEKNQHIKAGSETLWNVVEQLIESGSKQNLFAE